MASWPSPAQLDRSVWSLSLLLAAIALSATLLGDPIGGPDETLGIPWQGDPGISETVDEIMQRQAVADEEQPDAIREKGAPRKGEGEDDEPGRAARRAHRRHHPPHQNPDAPAVSHWPTGGGVDDTAAGPVDPTVDASGVDAAGDGAADPLAPQSLGIDVVGATLAESGFIPPDAEGAVGPTQFLVVVNGRIRTLSKATGAADSAVNTTTNNFFTSVRNNSTTSDPRVTYDRLSERWFITMINTTSPNRVLVAVSSGPTISGMSSFTFFQFQQDLVGTTPNADTNGFADFPSLGVDANALYIGVNIFGTGGYTGSTGFVLNKANLIAGLLSGVAFRQLATNTRPGPFAPMGANNDDPSATQGYFIGVDTISFSTLQIRRVSNPGGTHRSAET